MVSRQFDYLDDKTLTVTYSIINLNSQISTLQCNLADGCCVKGNFLPHKTIQGVLDSLHEQVFVTNLMCL
jgi:hypothetical protein